MPVDLVQRGPFSYDELTVTASQAGASPSAPRDFTLTNAIFDSTIGEVLEVFVNGVKLVGSGLNATGDEFTVDGNISKITIVADSALNSAGDSEVTTLAENDTILIRRVSNRTAKKVDFAPGSVIREADLDNANTQVFHTAQEAIDIALQGMVLDADGRWNASSGGANRVIKNAATPSSSDPADYVATKGYVDGQNATTTVASISGQVTTVAGISDDVTTVAGAVKETVAYTLTASGGKFYIAGGEFSSATSNPVLNLQRGSTYTFDYSDSSISSGSHVLGFSSADTNTNNSGAVAYTGSANGISDNTVDKIITFVVPASAPDTLYYYCTAHNAMGNTMNIAEDSIEIVADNIANVNKVGAIDDKVTTVAGLGTNGADVTTVAGIHGNVTTVAGIHGNVTTVAGLGTNGADVTTVAGKSTEIDVLVNKFDGSTTATSGTKRNITAVNEVATKIDHVDNFNDTYHTPSGTAPSGSNVTEGDLWYDTANDVLKVYDGSSWASASSSIATVASQNEFTASDGQGTDSKYFALNHDVGLELVFLNGVRLKRGSDYYCTNSNTSTTPISSGNAATFVRLETVPGSSDILSVMAFGQIANNLAVNTAGGTFTGGVTFEAGTTHNTGSNTFTMPTTRGTNEYVLTRDDSVGTGGTTWKETSLAPTISSITYPTQNGVQATALAATGAQDTTAETLLINGQNFTSTVTVNISGNGVSSSAFAGTVSVNTAGTVITCSNVTKQASADAYTLTVTNTSGLNTTTTVNFSADPSFTTASGSLGTVYAGTAMSTKTITAGSSVSWYEGTPTMPTWMTHFADGATGTSQNLTGTPTNSGTSEVQNFNIIIRDSENQSHNRDFSLTVSDLPLGGTIIEPANYNGSYRSHKFLNAGNGTSTNDFVLYVPTVCDILMVGGGGGGGYDQEGDAGGGGAGGMRVISTTLSAGTYTISVGAGGDGGSSPGLGGDTTMTGQTAAAGGGYGASQPSSPGANGGSGGGGGGESNTSGGTGAGSLGTNGNTPGYYGGDGGTGNDVAGNTRGGAGGGGASQDGQDATSSDGGHGGEGLQNNFETGNAQWYAAGGSGGHKSTSNTAGPVINGISGKGGDQNATTGSGAPTAGVDGTGAGGGGGYGSTAGQNSGGDGVVIIRYAI